MLNDIQCRNAKPQAKPYKLTDSKGLYLEIKPNGVKAWRYRFRLSDKESVFAIGDYGATPPALTLADARKKREQARDLVKQGINPAHHRQMEKIKRKQETATTFEDVALEWLALKDWAKVTKDKRQEMLKRVVFPTIGALPVKQVTSSMILNILKKAADNNGVSVMAEAKRTMYGIFELLSENSDDYANPVRQWKEALPKNKTQHKRALCDIEIGQLLRDLEGYQGNFQTVAAFRLMWFTLCRPSEAIEAQWTEFDLDAAIWCIPAERMKKRKEHVMPLPTQAVEVLRSMHGVTGNHFHVFPNRDDRTKPMTSAAMRQALRNMGWSGKYSPHATRTTGSTKLNEMGYPSDWIERQLAHVEMNAVRRTYNHAGYLTNRTDMMQKWADYLDKLKSGAEIIPLRA
ncbi:MAG: Integrase [Candidatus Nitrotoga sp. LAW]|nr:MAG: Integrase [Candidatus Nitrotoga sp. LAW]